MGLYKSRTFDCSFSADGITKGGEILMMYESIKYHNGTTSFPSSKVGDSIVLYGAFKGLWAFLVPNEFTYLSALESLAMEAE